MSAIRIGVITPHAAIGPEEEIPAMAPASVTHVVRIGSTSQPPRTPSALRSLTSVAVLDAAAGALAGDSSDCVGYASTTSAYVVGFDAETAMVARLSALLGVPVASTCESAVQAMRALGVVRVALVGAPWFDPEFNELGAAYFRSQGFDVVSSASAELPDDPHQIEPTDVCAWVSGHVGDDADGVFIGGNGFRATTAIDRLESTLGRPVLTSNQVLLWNLLAQIGSPLVISWVSIPANIASRRSATPRSSASRSSSRSVSSVIRFFE